MFKPSVSGFLVDLSMKEEWRCCATEPMIQVYCMSLHMRLYMSTLPFIYVIMCFLVNAICQGLRLSYVRRNAFLDVSTCDMYTYSYAAALENQALYSS